MGTKGNILFLEDDDILAESLIELLEDEGFAITHVTDGEAAIDVTFDARFDLYLFDVNVDKLSGFELLRSLRSGADATPAIFLTAMGDIASIAEGFEVGADDYIKKPFDFEELLIRIKAILKKRYNIYGDFIKIADFTFDIEKEELYHSQRFIPLAPVELMIVKVLFQNLDHTLSKEVLLESFAYGSTPSEGSLRVHINKLRKIGLPIQTVKGVGYRLASS